MTSAQAYALMLFCLRNPKACPILAVGDVGDPRLPLPGAAIDIRTILPRYRVSQHGHPGAEPTDIGAYWREDSVLMLLGCSHTFNAPLRRAGIEVSSAAPPVYTTMVRNTPDFGVVPPMGQDSMPVLWACGVTPQQVLP